MRRRWFGRIYRLGLLNLPIFLYFWPFFLTNMFIELKNVTKDYQSFRAVDNLSMTVQEGDIYGFLGPNGSGKSTTIRMILSLIRPTAGEIRLFCENLSTNRVAGLRRIGALIEKPDFYKYLSARQNLRILGKLSGVEPLNKRIDEVLDKVGLLSRGDSRVGTYSQGMKQRLGIAQTILHKPDLILLDEPTNGLDPQGQKEIRDLILDLKATENITILISSHILFEMEQIASRMIIINRGKMLVEGQVKELLRKREQQVSLQLDQPAKARELIANSSWSGKLVQNPDALKFMITRDEIPELTAWLMGEGLKIYAVEPVRSLEDYFLQITENATTD